MVSPRSAKPPPGWGRQKLAVDPLEQVGFVSRGDSKLLDPKVQESYFNRLVDRYMQFCSDYSKTLDGAFGALPRNPSDDPTRNPPVPGTMKSSPLAPASSAPKSKHSSTGTRPAIDPAAKELSILLLSMRKLREGILATSSKTPVPFSQRVHIFCIRVGILAEHPPSYYPPLERLVKHLDTRSHPLTTSSLQEFTTYLILDYACRQGNLQDAYALRTASRLRFAYESAVVDGVLGALVHGNWVMFWGARQNADGYAKTVMDWAVDNIRKMALKDIGRAYLTADVDYVLSCCAGEKGECTWEELVEKYGVGWTRDGDEVLIKVKKPPR